MRIALALALLTFAAPALAEQGLTLRFGAGLDLSQAETVVVGSLGLGLHRETRRQSLDFGLTHVAQDGEAPVSGVTFRYEHALTKTMSAYYRAEYRHGTVAEDQNLHSFGLSLARPTGAFGVELRFDAATDEKALVVSRSFESRASHLSFGLGAAERSGTLQPIGEVTYRHDFDTLRIGADMSAGFDQREAALWLQAPLGKSTRIDAKVTTSTGGLQDRHTETVTLLYELNRDLSLEARLQNDSRDAGPSIYLGLSLAKVY